MQPHDNSQPQFIKLGKDAKDITGQCFGRLIVLGPVARYQSKLIKWLCLCECGNTTIVVGPALRFGNTKSCGCLMVEKQRAQVTHGMSSHPLYRTWLDIIKRCTNPNVASYKNYGGRGIAICDEWRHDFLAFYNHVSQLEHYGEPGYSIDRIDNDGNYEFGNIRWATRLQQVHNRRKSQKQTKQKT